MLLKRTWTAYIMLSFCGSVCVQVWICLWKTKADTGVFPSTFSYFFETEALTEPWVQQQASLTSQQASGFVC